MSFGIRFMYSNGAVSQDIDTSLTRIHGAPSSVYLPGSSFPGDSSVVVTMPNNTDYVLVPTPFTTEFILETVGSTGIRIRSMVNYALNIRYSILRLR